MHPLRVSTQHRLRLVLAPATVSSHPRVSGATARFTGSLSRPHQPRLILPQPSLQQQLSGRAFSTTPPPPATSAGPLPGSSSTTPGTDTDPTAPASVPHPPKRRGGPRLSTVLVTVFSLGLGLYGGHQFTVFFVPPAPPPAGSAEDAALQASVRARAASLPLVRRLEADPAWTSWDAYSSLGPSDPHRTHRLTTGPLGSASGVGAYQRVFARRDDAPIDAAPPDAAATALLPPGDRRHPPTPGEMATVIYFGAATVGWPGVVHGGCVATVLDETLWRCAVRRLSGRAGVTASLRVTYKKPTWAEGFYVVRARPETEEETAEAMRADARWEEARKPGGGAVEAATTVGAKAVVVDDKKKMGTKAKENGNGRKIWIRGSLETLDGKVCVEARGLFVVPKGMKLSEVTEGF